MCQKCKKKKLILSELIDINFLQEFQDAFAKASGIACIIIDDTGYVTKPSNFNDFCMNYLKKRCLKNKECNFYNLKWKEIDYKTDEALIYKCNLGLTNFVVPIIVDNQHIASILAGQVIQKSDEKDFKKISKQLGIDKTEYTKALKKIKVVTPEQIKATIDLLNIAVNSIVEISNKNLELIRKNEREKLSKKITKSIRSSLDIEKTLEITCYILAKSFDIERVVVVEFPNPQNLRKFYIRKEFKAKKSIKSPQDIKNYQKIGEFAALQFLKSPTPLVIDNIEKSNYPKFFKDFYKIMGVKSLVWMPIMLKGQLWGTFTLSNISGYKKWLDEEIQIISDTANQISIAINQAQLYTKEKETAEREALLRKAIEIFRSTNDSEVIKKHFLEIISNYFNADRALFCDYDRDLEKFLPFKTEKINSPDIKSLVGFDVEEKVPAFEKRQRKRKNVIIKDLEKTLSKIDKSSEEYKALFHMYKYGVKSDYGLLIEYKGILIGVLIIHFVKEKRILNSDEMKFLKVLRDQVGTALYQAELFKGNKQAAENENVLRRIMLSLASTFDFQEIIISIVNEAGNFFKADRCFYVEVDPETNSNRPVKEWAEYLSSPDIRPHSSRTASKEETEGFVKLNQQKKMIVCSNLKKEVLPKETRKMLEELSVKSYLVLPVYAGDIVYGAIVFHYVINYKTFTKNDLYIATAIANQISVAINQAGMYQKQKYNAEKEKLLRDTIETIRNSINIEDIENKIVKEVGNRFNADRVFISRFDPDSNTFLPFSKTSEYLSGYDVKSCSNFEIDKFQAYANIVKNKKILKFHHYKDFLKNHKNEVDESYLYEYDIKSILALPLSYNEKLYGALFIQYTKKNYAFNDDELILIKIITDQTAIAIHQAELFKENKQIAENESVLRQIMLSSVATFNYEQIVNSIVYQAGKYFKADRCFYIEIDSETISNRPIREWAEYLSSPDIKSHTSTSLNRGETGVFVQLTLMRQIITCPDLEKEDIPHATKSMLQELSVKSYLVAPVYYGDVTYGAMVLHYVKNFKYFAQSDVYMAQAIANQSAIIMNQSEIYKKQKNTAEREYLLRRITETMKLTLYINEVKQKIVNEIGKTLNANRCYLRTYNQAEDLFLKPDVEYLSSPDIKSLIDIEPDQEALQYFLEQVRYKPNSPIQITQNSIADIKNPSLEKYFKKSGTKAHFAMPIWDKEKNLTFLVLQYNERDYPLSEEESKLLITLAKQIAIAFNQSNLYKETKQQAEREKITQNVINIIRSSLELDVILRSVCEELFKMFDVQRIFVSDINFEKKENFVELVTSDEVIKFTSVDEDAFVILSKYWKNELHRSKSIKSINDIEKSDMPEEVKRIYTKAKVFSIIAVPIKSKEKIWGAVFLSSMNKYYDWTKDDKRFLESIVTQLDTAIRQAELYENQRRAAIKERVLKDIISEIKLTRDLHQAYETLLKKLAQIFDLNRTLFLESSKINPEELNIKYEYVIEREDMTTNNLVFPQVCIDEFLNLIHKLQPLILNDVSICYPEDEETKEFFKKYKIQALLSFPLIKYNKEVKVLGFIVLCSEEIRKWSDEEIELMKAISDSVVSVIWEIAKFIETEELRDSFVSTLAHDFQVPLIGEKIALEYMLQYSETELGENGKIIKEIFENNQNIIELLNKSVDIYNYESGKKKLNMLMHKPETILKEAVILAKEFADSKEITINFKKSDETMYIEADKKELFKVFSVLIENAIEHSFKGNEIKIEYYEKGGRVIISIHNTGNPITLELQEKIFNRYEMAQAIERKIGAGTGLFLAKKIVEAHNGAIWFKTDKKIGTIFYVRLPLVSPNEKSST